MIMILMVLAMRVPDPRWPGMILRCDDKNEHCYWSCDYGEATERQRNDDNEFTVSTGCVHVRPAAIEAPPCRGNVLYDNITPT